MMRVSENCEQQNPCNENNCPKHSECIPSWHNYTCRCHTGEYFENNFGYDLICLCYFYCYAVYIF